MKSFIEAIDERIRFQKQKIDFNKGYLREDENTPHNGFYKNNILLCEYTINELETILRMTLENYDKES